MEIITFSRAADAFGVSSATISRWVKEGKLKEGPKAGKQKTVTQKSTDALAKNSAFQMGRESTKHKITQLNAKKEEMKDLKQRIENLENLVENISEEIKTLRKITQKYDKEIATSREITQSCDKKRKGTAKK